MLVHGYFGKTWSESLVFKVQDGWCDNVVDGIGLHCFGDFGLAYYQGDFYDAFPVDYVADNFITTNTPLSIVIFKLFGLLGYDGALTTYIIISIISIVFPLLHASRGMEILDRSIVVVFGGILAAGTIATLDRGNHIGFLVTPTYLYLSAMATGKSRSVVLWGVVVAALKFWGVLFLLPLLVLRRLKNLVLAGSLTVLAYLIPLASFEGGFASSVRTMFQVNVSNRIASITAPYNISANGLVQRVVCGARRGHWCNTSDQANHYALQGIVAIVVVAALLVCIALIVVAFADIPLVGLGCLTAVPQFVVHDAALYSTVFSCCLLALAISWSHGSQDQVSALARQNPLVMALMNSVLVVTVVPIAMTIKSLSWWASSNGSANPEFKIQYWLYPMSWLFFFVASTGASIRILLMRRRCKPRLRRAS